MRGKPESESKREAPVEQLWERNREGRKETDRKPSTGIWKEGTGNQAREKEETEEAKAKAGTGKADVRRNQEEEERKSRRLSSQNRKKSGRKKANWKGKDRKRKHEVST